MGVLSLSLCSDALLLYAVTDRSWLGTDTLEDQVQQAILGGVTMVQLREKDLATQDFIKVTEKVAVVTGEFGIPLIINDNIEVALALDAAGLHIGQGDFPAVEARKMLGPNKILGVSVGNVTQALAAERAGADYIGVGAVFATGTKVDADSVSLAVLREICREVSIPVVAIGGINETNAMLLKGSGIKGIAVVSAIFAKLDISKAASELLSMTKEIVI